MKKVIAATLVAAVLFADLGLSSAALAQAPRPGEPQFRALMKELVETNTAFPGGDCTRAVEQVAARMKAAGFPDSDLHVFKPDGKPAEGMLVAVYPGRDPKAKAVLLLGHIDVVFARREDWTRDPYKLVEEDVYFYVRGVADMKAQAAIYADSLIRYRQEGYKPKRTIKMALTCGEDSPSVNGARWLVENQRQLIDAGIAINEGGAGDLDAAGKPVSQNVEAAQKWGMTFIFEATNPGGHSSRPRPDNAIYSLARAVDRMSRYDFPVEFNAANRSYFTLMAKVEGGEVGQAMTAIVANPNDEKASAILNRSPAYHTMLRTTCVATMLEGGHAANALPQRARATINCRAMPGTKVEDVQATLAKLVDDPEISITTRGGGFPRVTPSPINAKVMGPIETASARIWPGVPVIPYMTPGATDGTTLNAAGIPTYGVSGLFRDPDGNGIHGLNERLRVKSVMDGRDFLYALVKGYADQRD